MLQVLDPVYGAIDLPNWVREIINTPELHRLSEIRLMNVCGPTLIGATTTTRLEHALGVAHLADVYSRSNRLDSFAGNNLILGCLIHDVASYPYGHLVENVFKYLYPGVPDHADRLLRSIFSQKEDLVIYRGAHCQLYRKLLNSMKLFGRPPMLSAGLILGPQAVYKSTDISYEDALHPDMAETLTRVISGIMDLDNIDNVFRIAHRFGIGFDTCVPEKLAGAFVPSGTAIRMKTSDLWLLEEWLRVRSLVYEVFFMHPDILAMKALLTYCVEQSVFAGALHESDWVLTDIELLEVLLSLDAIRQEARQILLGHELSCLAVVVCTVGKITNALEELAEVRDELAGRILVRDRKRNKTDYIGNLEREHGGRRLFLTAEHDRGGTARRCSVDAIAPDGITVRRSSLWKDSNRVIISGHVPNWCTVVSPRFPDILRDVVGARIGCAPTNIRTANRFTVPRRMEYPSEQVELRL